MEVFGLDQEGYDAAPFLFQRLLDLNKKKIDEKIIKKTFSFLKKEYGKDINSDNHPLHRNLLESEVIKAFFDALDSSNAELQQIIKDLKITWNIFALYDTNRNENLEKRANYMKQLFVNKYKEILKENNKEPKMLIKMGALHTLKGYTSNSIFDIGNLIHELSIFNETKSLSIAFEFRYYISDDGKGFDDNANYDSKWINEMKPLILLGKKDEWTVIDLRPLKEKWINGEYWFYREIRRKIVSYDLIVVPPASYDTTPNYEVK